MAFKVRRKKGINAIRVAMKIISTVIALWIGGFAYNIIYQVMNGSCSPYYQGLKLVGFTIGTDTCQELGESNANTITGLNSTSLLAVVGVLAMFWIVFEFIDVRM